MQLFYIISGFLISYVLTEVRSYKTVGAFYANRYLRLFPVYAVVALLTLIAYTVKGEPDFFATYAHAPPAAVVVLVFSNATLFLQDWVMFLGVRAGHLQFVKDFYASDPQLYKGLLAWQAWTLGVELTFYAVAPFILKNRRLIWLALGLSIALRVIFIVRGFGLIDPWTYRFFPTELALFLCGSLSHQMLLRRYELLSPARLLLVSRAATVGMLVLCVAYPIAPFSDAFNTAVLLGAFIVLAPATFEFQRRTRWDNAIGKLSYPVYICHMLVLWIVHHVFWHFGWTVGVVAVSTATIVGSIVFAYVLELVVSTPVEALRKRIRTRASTAQQNAAG